MKLPCEVLPVEEDFFTAATGQIFLNGVFGFTNAGSSDNRLVQQLNTGRSRVGMTLRNVTVYLFPSLKTLSLQEEFSYLRTRPYLLPYAWAARVFSSIRRRNVKNAFRKVSRVAAISDREVDERNEYLRSWGLL